MSDIGGPLFIAIFSIATGIVLLYMGMKTIFLIRIIQNIPVSKIRSIAMGLVEVYGKVVPIKILKSPCSGDDCVYYNIAIEDNGHEFYRTFEGNEQFVLKDKTGEVLIDCNRAKFDIMHSKRFDVGKGKFSPQMFVDFLKSKNLKPGILMYKFLKKKKDWILIERIIKPGDKIYVLGTALKNPKTDFSPKHTENIIIGRGKNDRIFYISDTPEKSNLSNKSIVAKLSIIAGIILIVGGFSLIGFVFYQRLFIP